MLRDDIEESNEGEWIHNANAFDWREIDRNLRAISKRRAALDAEEARWLREAVRAEIWREVGAACLEEYLEHRLGYTPRVATDRVRVAMALEELPELTEALETGELPFTAVRELVRVATPKTESWREAARGKNVHQIEQAVAGRVRGDLPSAPPRPELKLHPVRYDLRPETYARVREAHQVLEAETGLRIDDDAFVSALCDAFLGTREPARAQHQIQTIECARCGQGWQDGAGTRVAIDTSALSRAHCDAERIDPKTQNASQDITPKVRRFVWHRDGARCTVPGCRSKRHLEIHHVVPRAQGGTHEADNLTLLCGGHHRAHHDGQLAITGKAPTLAFDRRPPAHVGREPDVVTEVHTALVTLGFSHREATAALAHARQQLDSSPTHDQLIRAALRATIT